MSTLIAFGVGFAMGCITGGVIMAGCFVLLVKESE